jgi:hypothetical protein
VNELARNSEVAQLRERIQLEYEAAQQGLSGMAQGTARHAFITQRLENMALHHQVLQQLVGEYEAIKIFVEVLEEPHTPKYHRFTLPAIACEKQGQQ